MAALKPINLERRQGYPFVMVFLYTPNGVRLLTGDLGRINKYCKMNFPTCHGMTIFHRQVRGISLATTSKDKSWRLFRSNAYSLSSRDRVMLVRPANQADMKFFGLSRQCYALVHGNTYSGFEPIRTWRRLPKKYINWDKIINDANRLLCV